MEVEARTITIGFARSLATIDAGAINKRLHQITAAALPPPPQIIARKWGNRMREPADPSVDRLSGPKSLTRHENGTGGVFTTKHDRVPTYVHLHLQFVIHTAEPGVNSDERIRESGQPNLKEKKPYYMRQVPVFDSRVTPNTDTGTSIRIATRRILVSGSDGG
jgi:hypothetical protein